MPTRISRFSSLDLTPSWFFLTTKTNLRPPSAATAPRGTAKTPIRSRELMRTFTLIFGSSSSLSLFTAQSNSPTLRVPGDLHRLIRFQRAELRLIDEGPHANLVQVRHFRQQLSHLHIIPGFHRQRVERSIGVRS